MRPQVSAGRVLKARNASKSSINIAWEMEEDNESNTEQNLRYEK